MNYKKTKSSNLRSLKLPQSKFQISKRRKGILGLENYFLQTGKNLEVRCEKKVCELVKSEYFKNQLEPNGLRTRHIEFTHSQAQ